jgi:hypothetical protein
VVLIFSSDGLAGLRRRFRARHANLKESTR